MIRQPTLTSNKQRYQPLLTQEFTSIRFGWCQHTMQLKLAYNASINTNSIFLQGVHFNLQSRPFKGLGYLLKDFPIGLELIFFSEELACAEARLFPVLEYRFLKKFCQRLAVSIRCSSQHWLTYTSPITLRSASQCGLYA